MSITQSCLGNTTNSFFFNNDLFQDNRVSSGMGGAASITSCPDTAVFLSGFVDSDSSMVYNRTWDYRTQARFQNVSFQRNEALCAQCQGGALHLMFGTVTAKHCRFSGNQVPLAILVERTHAHTHHFPLLIGLALMFQAGSGGAITVEGESTSLSIHNSVFTRNRASAQGGDVDFESGGTFMLHNVSTEVEGATGPFLVVFQAGLNSSISTTDVACSPGSVYLDLESSPFVIQAMPWGKVWALSLLKTCLRCASGLYAVAGANLRGLELHNTSCLPCPSAADCSRGGADVYTLPGYWCAPTSRSPANALECRTCPDGYCETDKPRPWHLACVSNRRGTLCGECRAGHGEAFGSEDCVPNTDCSPASGWMLPALLGIGMCYVGLVLWLPVNHHPLWKSITYFMQTAPLVSSPDNVLMRATMAVFALDPSILGIHVTVCPWAGLTAVEKMAADYVLPAVLLLELALVLAGHRLLRSLLRLLPPSAARKRSINVADDEVSHHGAHDASEYARYAGALTALVLLMYEGVTSATMDLLNCVPWDGALRLFRAGYIACYVEWQYPLFVLLGGFVVPFPLLLVLLRRWLSSRQRRLGSSAGGWAVLHVLEGPYARGRTWWESVGMLRRLALLAVATFVPDPMWRALGLAGGCFVVLLSHVYLRPCADRYYGWAETLFLCDLTLVAGLQIPQATFAALGQPFEGTAAEVVSYLQEALALLPLAFCVYVFTRQYGPPLLDWLWRKRCNFFLGSEDAGTEGKEADDQEGRNKPHRRQAADDDEEERLLSDDGAEHGAEDEDEASMMHRTNEDSPSLAKLVELQVGRFSQYLDATSL